jgi:hypothetical protein
MKYQPQLYSKSNIALEKIEDFSTWPVVYEAIAIL